MGGTHIQPLFAAQKKNDKQPTTSTRQNQPTYNSDASLSEYDKALENMRRNFELAFKELDEKVIKDIKETQARSKKENKRINLMIEDAEKEGDRQHMINMAALDKEQKAIDDAHARQVKELNAYDAINKKIKEKSKKDHKIFLATQKKNKKKEEDQLREIYEKSKKEARKAKKEQKELQRQIDALKRKKSLNEEKRKPIQSNITQVPTPIKSGSTPQPIEPKKPVKIKPHENNHPSHPPNKQKKKIGAKEASATLIFVGLVVIIVRQAMKIQAYRRGMAKKGGEKEKTP